MLTDDTHIVILKAYYEEKAEINRLFIQGLNRLVISGSDYHVFCI